MSERNNYLVPVLTALIVAACVATAWYFVGTKEAGPSMPELPVELQDTMLSSPQLLEGFQLQDQHGRAFGAERFQGHWSLVFFGYTHCPDICPTTLTVMKAAWQQIPEQERQDAGLQAVFVSVDPQRDSLEHLGTYLHYFDPGFIGVTGERAAIDSLARQMGAVYMFEGDTNTDSYIVNHSAAITLVAPDGRLVARFHPPHSPTDLAQDFQRVRQFYGD